MVVGKKIFKTLIRDGRGKPGKFIDKNPLKPLRDW